MSVEPGSTARLPALGEIVAKEGNAARSSGPEAAREVIATLVIIGPIYPSPSRSERKRRGNGRAHSA